MKLDIPLIIQKKNSEECGLACLAMVLKFYNASKSLSKLRKQIHVYPWIWIFMPQLWSYLLEQWFEVEIISMNPHIVTYQDSKKSQSELLQYFSALSKKTSNVRHKTCLQYFVKFMELWGIFTPRIPSPKDIKKWIDQHSPLLTIMTSNFLWSSLPSFNFHFHVITWIDKSYVYVNDPMYGGFGGQKKIPIDTYMYSIYASAHGDLDNAALLLIRKSI